MKELFNTLSNVSQFFREKRFINKAPGNAPKRQNDPRWAVDPENPDAPKKGQENQAIKRRKLKSFDEFLHTKKLDEAAAVVGKGKIDPKLQAFTAKAHKGSPDYQKRPVEHKQPQVAQVKKVVKKPKVEKEHLIITGKHHEVHFTDATAEKKTRLKDLDIPQPAFIKIVIRNNKYHPSRVGKPALAYKDPSRGGNYYFIDSRKERVKIGNKDIFVPGTMLGESDQKKYGAMAKKAIARDKARRRRRPRPAPAPAPAPAPPKSPEEVRREKDIAVIAKLLKTDDLTQDQANNAAESLYKTDPTLDPTTFPEDKKRIDNAIKHFTVLNYRNRKEELKKSKDVTKAVLDTYTWLVNNPKAKKYIGKELGTQLNPRTAEKYWVLAHVKLLTFNKHQRDIIAKKGHNLNSREARLLNHLKTTGYSPDMAHTYFEPDDNRVWVNPSDKKNFATIPGTSGDRTVRMV